MIRLNEVYIAPDAIGHVVMNYFLELLQHRLSVYTLFFSFSLPFAYFAIQVRYPPNSIAQKKAQAILIILAVTTAAFILAHTPFVISEGLEYRILAFMHLAPPVLCLLFISHVRSLKLTAKATPSAQNTQQVFEHMTRSVEKSAPNLERRKSAIEKELASLPGIQGIDTDYLADISDGLSLREIVELLPQALALSLETDEEELLDHLEEKSRAENFEDAFAELVAETRNSRKAANS